MRSVAIATCAQFPEGDEDGALLVQVAEARGISLSFEDWRDEGVDWSNFDATVIRNTWDYTDHLAEFLSWAQSVERLFNPASVVAWNTDKRYLEDLAAMGIPTIPTTYLASHEELAAFSFARDDAFVLKPSVGAGSMGAERFDAGDEQRARDHARGLLDEGKVVMVQPYITLVEQEHETAVILVDGWPSHAIAKGPMLVADALDRSRLFRQEQISARVSNEAQQLVAVAAHAGVVAHLGLSAPLLYARVDLVPTDQGPVVIEFEATEPSLFLGFEPSAAEVFVEALSRRLG